jgi:hypothetical protein
VGWLRGRQTVINTREVVRTVGTLVRGEVVVCPDQRCLQTFTDTSSLRTGTRA